MKKRPDTSVKSVLGRSFINSMNEPCCVVLWGNPLLPNSRYYNIF